MANCTLCDTELTALYTHAGEVAMRSGLSAEPYGYSCPKCERKTSHMLLEFQPTATLIKLADGECPDCGSGYFFSYRLPTDDDLPSVSVKGEAWENCGYFCENCGWANAGKREFVPLGR